MSQQTDRIRALNDELRRYLIGGLVVTTSGVAALGQSTLERIVRSIQAFDDFDPANDPHNEHDFGAIKVGEHSLFFKIDYYDQTLCAGSPDPSNPDVTERVMTIMLAEEY
jgi:hypothetical protein